MPSSEPTRSLAASLDRATLGTLLRPIVGPHPRVDGYTTVRDADDYAVLIVDLIGPSLRIVVRLAGPRAMLACPFDRTAAINRIVRGRTTVPTPEALAADVSYRDWPWRYLVTTHSEGATWAETTSSLDVAARRDLYRQLGQAVTQLHTIDFPAYGEIGADGRVAGSHSLSAALQERARLRVADSRHAALFVRLLRDRAHLFDDAPGPTLCHEDLNPTNILLRQDDGGVARGGDLRLRQRLGRKPRVGPCPPRTVAERSLPRSYGRRLSRGVRNEAPRRARLRGAARDLPAPLAPRIRERVDATRAGYAACMRPIEYPAYSVRHVIPANGLHPHSPRGTF